MGVDFSKTVTRNHVFHDTFEWAKGLGVFDYKSPTLVDLLAKKDVYLTSVRIESSAPAIVVVGDATRVLFDHEVWAVFGWHKAPSHMLVPRGGKLNVVIKPKEMTGRAKISLVGFETQQPGDVW